LFASPWILPVSVKERIQMTTLSEDEKMEIEMKGAGRLSTTEQKYDPSTQGRFEIWKLAMDIFKKNPFLGTGYDTFGALQGFDTHNNYLKVLAEIGIMGFLIYLYLYYLAFKCGWNLFRIATEGPIKGLGLGFAACVITNMLCNLAHDNWTYLSLMGFYWVLLALVVRASMITNQLQQKEVNSSHLNDS
jgi:O-antigen ligase